ncbi:MAG: DUF4185 domain-containing protein [Mycobacterium sp.]|uniref:DUF4185 domain-containing protein n=1 Tax=Mycobacterium sp. TaxID=1785 RepID=UPI001EC73A5E|nr:DUF4185 domain-containing protein [Mycobacterium sp.]MBW0016278.1 DUF4185 domain-containing protein [Mycobacterium sp.]
MTEQRQNARKTFALKRGEIRNLGPIAGTGSGTGRIGIGAVDLGEMVVLADGMAVAIGGDGWTGDWLGPLDHPSHYPSVGMIASPESLGAWGPVRVAGLFGAGDGSRNELFAQPSPSRGNTLPAGTVQLDGTTYVMVAGTTALKPTGGTWLVEAKSGQPGWTEVPGSLRPGDYADGGQSQISGYQGKDGNVYVAADAFDRTHGITLYRAEPGTFPDRSTWQPYGRRSDGTLGWGAAKVTPITGRDVKFGEISMREIGGKTVLSGFNVNSGSVEVRVADNPTKLFTQGHLTTIATQQDVPQNYGGYIVPGSTLDHMRILVSQWHVPTDRRGRPKGPGTYNVQELAANVNR